MSASKSIFGAVMFMLCLAASTTAGPLDDATAAIRKGDYGMAHQILRPLADKGDALAQFNLGQMHARGLGVQRDYTEAIAWLRKAADQGLAIAQHYLGLAYTDGDGVPQDDAEAAKWFRFAAERGYPHGPVSSRAGVCRGSRRAKGFDQCLHVDRPVGHAGR